MSPEETNAMNEARRHVQRRLKRLARDNTEELNKMLGRLSERYDVEFSPMEGPYGHSLPLSINLKDKHVTVPLSDWGSGTQNRTHILMAMLKANRIRSSASQESRITPIVVIEEPESFLHPSAQAEFGRILKVISDETGIQLLVTSHSPYMLNQQEPAANLLLEREVRRGQLGPTHVLEVAADHAPKASI